jgi:glutathione S-transferase
VQAAPILYSFRRCPYAIRARLALAAAGLRPGCDLELREVSLKARPPELMEASPKATVPVLVRPDGAVLDESLAIMRWGLQQNDPHDWLRCGSGVRAVMERQEMELLLNQNDGPLKHHLDRFKYPDRYRGEAIAEHRRAGLAILRQWNARLERGGWLLGDRPSLVDAALLPFVRQFRLADPQGFEAEPALAALQAWLARFLASPELAAVMAEPWGCRRSWHSPGWLYHLALAEEWRAARSEGVYARSTRGLSLQQVGFIHASGANQLEATWRRFYADAGAVVLLHIDPQRLVAAGVPVRLEPAPASGELFPHLYGALPLEAVVLAEAYP